MTRTALALLVGTLTLAIGLWTCLIQARNHARARELAELQRNWEMLEAANQQNEALAAAHVWGLADERPLAARTSRGPLESSGALEAAR